MKKITLALYFSLFIGIAAFSQTVNDVPIKDIDVEYIQIVGTSRLFSTKVNIQIDFGQRNKVFFSKDTRIVDENGKNVIFNSMIDALNFMSKTGYEFVQAYAFAVGNENVYHYLMKKSKEERKD